MTACMRPDTMSGTEQAEREYLAAVVNDGAPAPATSSYCPWRDAAGRDDLIVAFVDHEELPWLAEKHSGAAGVTVDGTVAILLSTALTRPQTDFALASLLVWHERHGAWGADEAKATARERLEGYEPLTPEVA